MRQNYNLILVLIFMASVMPVYGQDSFRLIDPDSPGARYGKALQDGPPFLNFSSTSQQYYIDHVRYNGFEDEV